jgi:hypothetical protein
MPQKNSVTQFKQPDDKPPVLDEKQAQKLKKSVKPKIQRVNKGFQVEKNRAAKWDLLVAQMKGAEDKKTGPELMDEALDYLFTKYLKY